MKYGFVSNEGSERLILVFAGWGMDIRPFAVLRRPGYDIAVLWDYRSLDIDWSFTAPYSEICVFAWSFGVYASAISAYGIESRVSRRVAINGTLYPVDRRRGIPADIFHGTLNALDDRNLAKFCRRMAGSAERYAAFCEHRPERSIDGLKEELEAFETYPLLCNAPLKRWDVAVIGRDDAIFPPVNQWRAWRGVPVKMKDAPHMMDLDGIIDRFTVDKQRVGERFSSGRGSYDDNAPVQKTCVTHLTEALVASHIDSLMRSPGARILEIGCGTGMLSRRLDAFCGRESYLELWDLVGPSPVPDRAFRQCDAELQLWRTPDSSFDLIASASTVQWFNSPTRFLAESLRILSPGGWLVFSTFAKGNLAEVEAATGRSLPLLSADEWRGIIPEGFETIEISVGTHTMDFDSPADVFRHLRSTGVNSLGRGNGAGESTLRTAMKRYPIGFDGKCRATYKPLFIILRKR